MTCLSTSCSFLVPRFQISRGRFSRHCSSPSLSTQSPISSPSTITSTATHTDSRYTLSRTEATKNSERRLSELTRLQVTGLVSTHDRTNYNGIYEKETTKISLNFQYLNLH